MANCAEIYCVCNTAPHMARSLSNGFSVRAEQVFPKLESTSITDTGAVISNALRVPPSTVLTCVASTGTLERDAMEWIMYSDGLITSFASMAALNSADPVTGQLQFIQSRLLFLAQGGVPTVATVTFQPIGYVGCQQLVGFFTPSTNPFFYPSSPAMGNGFAFQMTYGSTVAAPTFALVSYPGNPATFPPLDKVYEQSEWNLDKLDGTGLSKINLATAPSGQMWTFVMRVEDGRLGRFRFGLIVDDRLVWFHQIRMQTNNGASVNVGLPATVLFRVPAGSASAPVGASALNWGQAALYTEVPPVVTSIGSVFTSGGARTTGNATAGTFLPLLTLRPPDEVNKRRGLMRPLRVTVDNLSSSKRLIVRLLLNTTLTGASFVAAETANGDTTDPASGVAVDLSASALSGGRTISTFFVAPSATVTYDVPTQMRSLCYWLFRDAGAGWVPAVPYDLFTVAVRTDDVASDTAHVSVQYAIIS
jgi:hypothetical protein